MGGRHRYDECEDVIDECVERFVHERSPRKSGHRLQFIVDEQLRQHEQKAECIDTIHQRIYGPRIPTENENPVYFEPQCNMGKVEFSIGFSPLVRIV